MTSCNRRRFAIGLLLSLLIPFASPARAADEPAPAKRTPQQIMADLNASGQELQKVVPNLEAFFDETKRADAAQKAIPPMKKMLALLEEVGEVQPLAKAQVSGARNQFFALLCLLGDNETIATVQKNSTSPDPATAANAKAVQLLTRWWKSSKNAPDQAKVVDELQTLAAANAQSNDLTQLVFMAARNGAASPELRARVEKIITDDLKSEAAKQFSEQIKATQKLSALVGKPLTIAGLKVDGQQFSSDSLKGKVVLVDFWATWCGPCMQELPRVKKAYADFHDKGLEIVGVSCDRSEDALIKFLADNKADMPWTQLFDKANPGWHALAKEFGVNGIPTMFLIDKKGVCRSVEARANYEELIPKLLEEK